MSKARHPFLWRPGTGEAAVQENPKDRHRRGRTCSFTGWQKSFCNIHVCSVTAAYTLNILQCCLPIIYLIRPKRKRPVAAQG